MIGDGEPVPHGLKEIVAVYGDPKVQMTERGEFTVDATWERANMLTIEHPSLPRGHIYVHRLAAEPLEALLDAWASIGGYHIRTFGCFAPRAQRGGAAASLHSWGVAFDLNAAANAMLVRRPADVARAKRDVPDAWIAEAKRRGWMWGGNFKRRWDPMHFQLATGY